MEKLLHILRRNKKSAESYWQDFSYSFEDEAATVATALMELPVVWEHSCLQKKCGACAMIVDGRPCLACDTKLVDLKNEKITIEPLRKFPVVEDLLVDRSSMMEKLGELKVWFREDALGLEEDTAFEASKCLQCGLCLEVCPNFYPGGKFAGMAAMAPQARIISKSSVDKKDEMAGNYKKSVYDGCGKSLACRDICPAKIQMENLLVKTASKAVWKR